MKNFKNLFIALVLIATTASYGQTRINLYGNYTFEDSFDSYYDPGRFYQGQTQGGFQYGIGIEREIRKGTYIELSYLRLDTNAPTQYNDGSILPKSADFDVALNYIMLGANQTFTKPGSKVEGFGGFMAGVGIVNVDNPTNKRSDSATKFAWGIKGGATIWATKKVGVKLQAQLLSITQSVGGGLFFGTGGASAGLSSYSSVYQFSLGGGLVFELGK
jgi:hypothetical protein